MNVSKISLSNFSLSILSENAVMVDFIDGRVKKIALAAIALFALAVAAYCLYRYLKRDTTNPPLPNPTINPNPDSNPNSDPNLTNPRNSNPRTMAAIILPDKGKLTETGSSNGKKVTIQREDGTIEEGEFTDYLLNDSNGRRTYPNKSRVSTGKFEKGELQEGQLTTYEKAADRQAIINQKFSLADRTKDELYGLGRVTTIVGSGKFIAQCLPTAQKIATKACNGEIITKTGQFDKDELSKGTYTKYKGQFIGNKLECGTVIKEENCDFSADGQGTQAGRVLWNGIRKTYTKEYDDLLLEKEETFFEGRIVFITHYTDGKLTSTTKIDLIKGNCVNGKLNGEGAQERLVTTFNAAGIAEEVNRYKEIGCFEKGELKGEGTIEVKDIAKNDTRILLNGFFENGKLNEYGSSKNLWTGEEKVGVFSKGLLKTGYRLFLENGQQRAEDGDFDDEGNLEIGVIGPSDIIETKVLAGQGKRISLTTDPKNPKIQIRKEETGEFKEDKLIKGSISYKKLKEGSRLKDDRQAFLKDDKEEIGTFVEGKLDGNLCKRKLYRSNTDFTEFYGKFDAGYFDGVGRVADKRRINREGKVAIQNGSEEIENPEEKEEEVIRIIAEFKGGKPCGKLLKTHDKFGEQSFGIALGGSTFLGSSQIAKSLTYDNEGLLTGPIRLMFGGPDSNTYLFIGALEKGLPNGEIKVYKGSESQSKLIYFGPFINGEPAPTKENPAEIHHNGKLIFKGAFVKQKPSEGAFRVSMQQSKYFVGPIEDDCPEGEGKIIEDSNLNKAKNLFGMGNSEEKVIIANKKSIDGKYEITTDISDYNDFMKSYDVVLKKFTQVETFIKRVKGYIANHK